MKTDKRPQILVYGIERFDFEYPEINSKLFDLCFEPFDTNEKFQDYDGVILFQSTFENVEYVKSAYSSSYHKISYQRQELLKRQNQLDLLLEKGGFVCFLMYRDFIDQTENADYRETDLCKIMLNVRGLYRKSLGRDAHVGHISRDEFRHFLKVFGSARTSFDSLSSLEPYTRPISGDGQRLTGFILFNRRYFVPCRFPSKGEVSEFFEKIASALVATSKKLADSIPDWVNEFKFGPEAELIQEATKLQERLEETKSKIGVWENFKRCLCYDGEVLVESVEAALEQGFGLRILKKEDEHKEDKVILDERDEEIVLVEIKGTNENIKSPNVYQADSHRGRREKPSDFPSILIVNTFIKSSNSIEGKHKEINPEQIKLAIEKKVLILRTIDLLDLLNLKEKNKIDSATILSNLKEKIGWLIVQDDAVVIKSL